MTLLSIENLGVAFKSAGSEFIAVNNVSFSLKRGETLALVGESGSGKSITALSLMQLLPKNAFHPKGSIKFDGKEIIGSTEKELLSVRGGRIGMIFQEPMTSLNPLHTIEKQVSETLLLHKGLDAVQAKERTLELLRLVALPEPEKRLCAYPHELSGGQRQRVMIAMAIANDPDLLIADEPTTALDVTVQAQILALLKDLQKRLGMALLLITHDLGIVRKVADKVCVMRRGEIVEQADANRLFAAPQHDYTKMLLASEPKGEAMQLPESAEEILSVENLKVHFPIKKGLFRKTTDHIKAVDGISFSLKQSETLGVVGESGSGKTTLGLAVLRLLKAHGSVVFMGQNVASMDRKDLRSLRSKMQIVFQDPFGSLSPRMCVGDIIAEGLDIHDLCASDAERDALVIDAMNNVGLDPEYRHRYPHEFSGGQRQRISIARAVILKPKLIVLDEPTSALDMSVQAQIVELLRELQSKLKISYIFISHDLRVVRALSHRVIVMRNGVMVEQGSAEEIFKTPKESYTKTLLSAALNLEMHA